MENKIAQMVTDKVIAILEECAETGKELPWRKGWIRPKYTGKKFITKVSKDDVAYNGVSGKSYSMLNQWLLGKAGAWATFKQIESLGGKVNKGAKSSFVVFCEMKPRTKTNEDGEDEIVGTHFFYRYHSVFHIATQTTGIDAEKIAEPIDVIETLEAEELPTTYDFMEEADKVTKDYSAREAMEIIEQMGDRAYYSPSEDKIHIPTKGQFKSTAEYYGTLFHEMIHSTGHKNRLDRLESGGFGSETYAKEELVAELGASFLCNMFGIDGGLDNSVAYIKGWLKALKNDNTLVLKASSKAEKAVELIMGNE